MTILFLFKIRHLETFNSQMARRNSNAIVFYLMVCGSHFSNSDSVTYGVGTPTPKAPFWCQNFYTEIRRPLVLLLEWIQMKQVL